MKKLVSTTLVMIFGLLLLTACQETEKEATEDNQTDTTTAEAATGEEITIGTLPAEAALPIILAHENGYFASLGVNVSIKTFTSPNDRNVALQANELDAAIGDVMTAAAFVDRGMDLKITSDINEDFKILSSPASDVTSMEALDQKSVSLVPNFILEYIMDEFADMHDFSYDIVEIPSFSGRAEALLSNQIDGVIFTEPQAGMLVEQGAHLLASSADAGIKGGTIFFTEAMLNDFPDDVRGFYTAYNQAIDYMNETDATAYADVLADYQFPAAMSSYIDSKTEPYQHAGVVDQDQFDSIIAWTLEKEQITQSYSYEALTDFSVIN
ncbi:NitT/TauT family transport system substrate-binding protein [Streptohalobacillus salinus]|uniref:NitT/TauT family transport system substrate-binding protein n=1 Tax=Streptohalobacillus salinus TaxID=621096 RepID=A0A2V3W087_9BACI|nr:ABC transporter substrate-binding protein [Streptohalobacillus salinus]PXW87196.1 NitT/TauT family transport system substrate-binding protein [Streptohalobacillus salinus]